MMSGRRIVRGINSLLDNAKSPFEFSKGDFLCFWLSDYSLSPHFDKFEILLCFFTTSEEISKD